MILMVFLFSSGCSNDFLDVIKEKIAQDEAEAETQAPADGTAPTVAIGSTATDPTNASPIPVTITFSEAVTGFVVGDITVGNGGASNFQTSDDISFTVDITPAGDPVTVTVDVASGLAADAAGNVNTAAAQFSIVYNSSVPTLIISSTASNPTNVSLIPITFTFSEAMTGFVVGDITIGNGMAGNLQTSDNTVFTADITPSADGTVTVDVVAGAAQSVATGRDNAAAAQFSITYDGTAPTGTININGGDTYTTSPNVTLTLSPDDGTGTGVTQMMLSNDSGFAGASWETFSSPRAWTLSSLPDGDKYVYTKFKDAVGNGSLVSTDSIILDTTPPSQPAVMGVTPTPDTTPLWDWNDLAGAVAYRYGYSEGTWITETATASEFVPSTPLSGTTHTLYVEAKDAAGNWSDTGSKAIQVLPAGYEETMSAGGVSFDMRAVPDGSFFTAPDDSGTAAVPDGFWIAETEVTYELWSTVHTWATSSGYMFANAGTMGDGTDDTDQHPVTTINWRDAMVWCNALTEYYNDQNGTSLECVYYTNAAYTIPIRSVDGSTDIDYPNPGSQDDPYVKSGADGFRLPTSDEWELAARYVDDSNSDGDIKDANEDYPGDHASGDTTSYCYPSDGGTSTVFGNYAWYNDNSGESTHVVATRTANALGLSDMSGNVDEWCFAWKTGDSLRVGRGCSWYHGEWYLRVGALMSHYPYYAWWHTGFRPARTP